MRYWDGTIVRRGDYLLLKIHHWLRDTISYEIHKIVSLVPKKVNITLSNGQTFKLGNSKMLSCLSGRGCYEEFIIVSKGTEEEGMKQALILETLMGPEKVPY